MKSYRTVVLPSMSSSLPTSIDGVIDRLDAVIDRSRREGSRLGYFAVLYRNVTVRVRDGIEGGRFDDGERMERLDVRFANRYLEAYESHTRGISPTQSWSVAFEAAERWTPIVLQHLLLGMNAHINLDLGIAAARTCPGRAIVELEPDFRAINAILLGMLDAVQDCVSAVSPWCELLDAAGGSVDELVARVGLVGTRDWAWLSALRLAPLAATKQESVIATIDRNIADAGRALLNPGRWLASVALVVRIAERKSVAEVMEALEV